MPELRRDPVTGSWVIIATERSRRPTDFIRSPVVIQGVRVCPFCPGNEDKTPPEVRAFRAGTAANAPGWSIRVVPNKFPALKVEGHLDEEGEGIYDRMNGVGAHEVIIESPDHQLTLATMPEKRVEEMFWMFSERFSDLKKDTRLQYVMVFKNHGEAAGASIEHTHSQLIALPVVPRRVAEEIKGSRRHWKHRRRCVYCDILRQESREGVRLILESDRFLVVTPYAPRFPFESWIIPKNHNSHFEGADSDYPNLAWVMQTLLRKMDRMLERPAYNFMIHTAPLQEGPLSHYHWHIEVIPKLTKVAGFEWGTGFYINPTPPEEAARFLRDAGTL
ncbi:MAG: galactose-1-phosphate uridylyltransferase [Acidobacteria bacterium]|nr:galactose-1-phosphate uridylyltransferase [Acidobacteriota bacterium]